MQYLSAQSAGKNHSRHLIVFIPIVFLVAALLYSASTAPWGREADPEYAYAMNGLAWAAGYQFQLFHHPGTTTLLLVGSIFKVWAALAGQEDIIAFGLKNFDTVIYAARAVEIAVLAGVLIVSGLIVRNATGSSYAAMLFQVAPFASLQAIHLSSILTPESLMFSSAVLGMALTIKAALDERPPSVRLGTVMGVVFAFGLSSKYLHLPLALVGIPALLRNWRALAASVAVAVFVFFAIHRAFHPHVFTEGFRWLYAIATHKGHYGAGDSGFIDMETFWPNMKAIVSAEPVIFAVFSIAVIFACARMIKSGSFLDPISLTLVASFFAMCAQLVATSKHFNFYYMLASWALTSGVLVLAVIETRRLFPRVTAGMAMGVAISIALVISCSTFVRAWNDATEQAALDRIGARLSGAVAGAAGSCANVTRAFVRAPEHPLSFGGNFTLATQEMEDRFSDAYARSFKNALLAHDFHRNELFKNFHPYTYEKLVKEYPCAVVRTFDELTTKTSIGLLEMKPDHCVIDGIQVYTIGISCGKIRDAYKGG
jgi:hypothetical protein